MTKREPFADVRPGCLLSCHAWILVVDGKVVGQHNVKESLLFRAEQLNAAHEARVKEAAHEARVKEAGKEVVARAQHQCGCAKCVNPPSQI